MKDGAIFYRYAQDIINNDIFQENKHFIQHGNITVYDHCVSVAALSFRMAQGKKNTDMRSLVRGALLHDFFLYDWHKRIWSLHGWMHPVWAAENAQKYFDISDKEFSIIRTHMWPYTALHPPRCREGWIICIADKLCSLRETLFGRSEVTDNF